MSHPCPLSPMASGTPTGWCTSTSPASIRATSHPAAAGGDDDPRHAHPPGPAMARLVHPGRLHRRRPGNVLPRLGSTKSVKPRPCADPVPSAGTALSSRHSEPAERFGIWGGTSERERRHIPRPTSPRAGRQRRGLRSRRSPSAKHSPSSATGVMASWSATWPCCSSSPRGAAWAVVASLVELASWR